MTGRRYLPAQKIFYGIGTPSRFPHRDPWTAPAHRMEIHAEIDHPDHDGASLFSVKPIIGFFFGFGWAGGYCPGRMYFLPAAALGAAGSCFSC